MADTLQNARLAYIKVGSATFSAEVGCSISITADLIETTNKSNTTSKQFIHDIYGATGSANTLITFDDTTGDLQDLDGTFLDDILAGTALTVIYVLSAAAPTVTISASAQVTEWSSTSNQGGVIEGSYSWTFTGDITVTETTT